MLDRQSGIALHVVALLSHLKKKEKESDIPFTVISLGYSDTAKQDVESGISALTVTVSEQPLCKRVASSSQL